MEHLSDERIAAYRARALSPPDALLVSDHLIECNQCRDRAFRESRLSADAAAIRARLDSEAEAFTHLTYDEMAGYVDGAPQAEHVQAHIHECAVCAAEIGELRVLKAELVSTLVPKSAMWAQIRTAMRGWRAGLAISAAAACALLVGVALYPRHSELRRTAEQPIVAPAPASTAVIADGGLRISVSPQGTVAGLDGLPAGIRASVEHALVARTAGLPSVAHDLAGQRDTLMGASEPHQSVQLLEPVGVVVEGANPVFRWELIAGAQYQVKVYTSDYEPAADSGWIGQNEWRSAVALARGRRYSWQLTVRANGRQFTSPQPPEPEARFQVLDAASENNLSAVKEAAPNSHLVLGIAYAQAGLLADARKELQSAADRNPGSELVAALLASLNSDRRQSK